uniref:Uncharacterized protein n=1 Tax=Romanomermis culicivorax TaxID=13658 RepID=A0A915IU73_ROMCU
MEKKIEVPRKEKNKSDVSKRMVNFVSIPLASYDTEKGKAISLASIKCCIVSSSTLTIVD